MSTDANPRSSKSERPQGVRGRRSSLLIRSAVWLAGVLFLATFGAIAYFWNSPGTTRSRASAEIQNIFLDDGPDTRPSAVATDGYIGSHACRECHARQHTSWHASYHRTMTQVASPQSIQGDFDCTRLELDNRVYLLGRDGDDFWVEFDDPSVGAGRADPRRIRRSILLCTGSHHMQTYWISTGTGRELAIFPFVWVIDRQRWIPRRMTFLSVPVTGPPPGKLGTMDFEFGQWNRTCVKCHTTHGKTRATDFPPQTTVAEFGISCEACHGPGEAHVGFHRDGGAEGNVDPLVHPGHLDKQRSAQVCARCHSNWNFRQEDGDKADWQGVPYRPGDDLLDHVGLANHFDPTMHWPDGKVRVLGREYHGLIDSPCHQRGELTCVTCHAMHPEENDSRPLELWADDQLRTDMRGNQACLQCHEEYSQPDTLAAHTHHPASSQGSVCYNCHMPNTSYSLLKQSRSHYITNPTVAETIDFGRPNACNLCHLDKTLQWTGNHLAAWHGQEIPEMADPKTTEIADSVRWALEGDAAQRAIMAWHMGWPPAREAAGDEWMVPYLAYLLEDDYAAVRQIAHRSLRRHTGYEDVEYEMRAPAADLRRYRDRVIERWEGDKSRRPHADPALLTLPSGKLDTDQIDELLRGRDHSPVELSE